MTLEKARLWATDPYFDLTTQDEVKTLMNSPDNLESAFYTELQFGTGGLRGIMGVGTSRMNIYTVRKATQGLATYLLKHSPPEKGVVIGFDSRINSELFAQETARVLLGNQIRVYLCKNLRPTPFISFACRHLNASAAIMITASHNPKEYNGYKVYWDDGAQIVAPHDTGIIEEIEKITSYSDVSIGELSSPLLHSIDQDLDEAYLQSITSHPIFTCGPKQLKICYSSLHGAGITLLPKALIAAGFSSPTLVQDQCEVNGHFPSAPSPNPEQPETLEKGILLLKETASDILFVSDPDADRLGCVVMHAGNPVILNGHQLAAIATYYLCSSLKGNIVTTIVTTPLVDTIAHHFGASTTRVLTGFKYIGEVMRQWETTNTPFLFGAEESLGYLIGTTCRDKDGIASACLFAEIAAHMKSQGKTLLDLLHSIYSQFGVRLEKAISINFSSGKEGLQRIRHLMEKLRSVPPSSLPIVQTIDYLPGHASLPPSDVLQWTLQDGTTIIIRPSGTEPKLKAYLSTSRPASAFTAESLQACDSYLNQTSIKIKELLNSI